ncbi:ABC transporter ATP-binding protein [Mollicutes bacterium LVI A0039]|nr:ABC transporter ATP-binding protein [Mollicutes bacterium LVI A0039]
MEILSVNNISKSFGDNQVIKGLSFTVKANTIYGFLGQNGAGKTTVMKMILGLHKIDTGTITVNGQQVKFGQTPTNEYIGYLADVPAFYDFMTPREYLQLCGKISKLDATILNERITKMLDLVGIEDNKNKIKGYSRGMRQRLGIASALLSKPLLLICDEPTSALDPLGRKQILDILAEAANETTIIFSTHILTDVERICDYVGILHNGTLALEDDIQSITNKYATENYLLEFTTNQDLVKFLDSRLFKIIEQTDLSAVVSGCDISEIYAQVNTLNIYPIKLEEIKSNLENVFLEVTNGTV